MAVAAFNIVSTLVMAVQREKYADIAILRTHGREPGLDHGDLRAAGLGDRPGGPGRGMAGGLAIAHNLDVVIPALETLTGATLWNKEIYYINELPSKVLQFGREHHRHTVFLRADPGGRALTRAGAPRR